MDAQHTKHVTYTLAYHFVWCPTYRKKILVGKLAVFIEQEIRRVCEAHGITTDPVGNHHPATGQRAFTQGRSMYFDDSEYDIPYVAHHMNTFDASAVCWMKTAKVATALIRWPLTARLISWDT